MQKRRGSGRPMSRFARRSRRKLDESEEILVKLFTTIKDGIAYLDRLFRFKVVNQAFAQAGGQEQAYYREKYFFELFPDPQMEAIFHQVLETGQPFQAYAAALEHFRGLNQTPLFWDWSLQPIAGRNGQVTHLVMEITDVTTHEETRRALQKTQTLFVHLFESTPEASILIDDGSRIVAINHQAEALFGYTRQELVGQPFEILLPEEKRDEHGTLRLDDTRSFKLDQRGPDLSNPHGGQPEFLLRRKDGSRFPAEIDLNPFVNDQKRMVLSMVRDISEVKLRMREARLQTELVRLLQDVAIAANEADSLESAFQFTLNRLCAFLQWPLGHAYLLEDNQSLHPTTIWCDESSGRFSVFRAVSQALKFAPRAGLPGKVIETQQPVWLTDLPNNTSFRRASEARQSGIKTGLAIPILANREVVGALEFFHEADIPPNPRLLAVLPHIGVQLGRVVERKRAEEALRKSAAQLRLVITNLPVILWVVDQSMRLILFEGKGVAAAGIDAQSMVGQPLNEWLIHRPDLLALHQRAFSGEEIHIDVASKKGPTFETFLTPYYDANGAVNGVIGLAFDVSLRRKMEDELEEMKHRLLESAENERSRLGQRLHDGPLQDLFGAYYQIQDVKNSLNPEGQAVANRALDTIQQVNATLRVICGELRPSTLVHLGLRRAILSHADHLKSSLDHIDIHFDLVEDSTELSYNRRLGLFRVYQQLINNAVRHANPTHIWVRTRINPDQIILEVQDNGVGFDLPDNWIELARKGHIGLASAVERIQAMRGELKISTRPGQGTLVQAVIPRSS